MGQAISIHSSHTGRDALAWQGTPVQRISIHSSHTGRDILHKCKIVNRLLFQSTLPIREETVAGEAKHPSAAFQSTLPIREETLRQRQRPSVAHDFNPLFPYGKRHQYLSPEALEDGISIHSSHTGRDRHLRRRERADRISIHSSHTGRDGKFHGVCRDGRISIHSSHTGRDGAGPQETRLPLGFQSTLPIREETVRRRDHRRYAGDFNPLFPYGKRRVVATGALSE